MSPRAPANLLNRGQLPRYRSTCPWSYCLGSFAVEGLLRHRPQEARRVVLRSGLPLARKRLLLELCRETGVGWEEGDALLRTLGHRNDLDALAVFDKYEDRLDMGADQLVLVEPKNPGNLGTIDRSLASFGVRDLALVGAGADPFSPHVIRASIGARFVVRTERFRGLDEYRALRRGELHLFDAKGDESLDAARFPSPFTLVFGPEWPGLAAEVLALGKRVAIPQEARMESLNLAVAVGIALYAATR